MQIIKRKLVLETPLMTDELDNEFQAKDNATLEDIIEYVGDYINENGWDSVVLTSDPEDVVELFEASLGNLKGYNINLYNNDSILRVQTPLMRKVNTTEQSGLPASTITNYFDFKVDKLKAENKIYCSEAAFFLISPKAQSTFVTRMCGVLREEYDIELKLDDENSARILAAGIAALGNEEDKVTQELTLSREGRLKLAKLIKLVKQHS